MESKLSYLKALDLQYKLNKEQFNLVWKAMDGYGEYREREAKFKNLHMPFVSGSFIVERMKLASKIREHLEAVGVKGLGKDIDVLIEQCLVQDGGRIFKNDNIKKL